MSFINYIRVTYYMYVYITLNKKKITTLRNATFLMQFYL